MRRTTTAAIAITIAMSLLAACSKQEPPQITINVPSQAPASPVLPSPPIESIPTIAPSTEMPADLPVSDARVEGLFGGKGFANSRFRFSPRCSDGPCSVVGTSGAITIKFARNSKGIYAGKTTENSTCSAGGVSTSTKVSYAIGFSVKAAEMIDGEWRATSLLTLTDIKRPYKKVTIGNKILTCKAYHKRSKGTSTLAAP